MKLEEINRLKETEFEMRVSLLVVLSQNTMMNTYFNMDNGVN